jgi:virginiamycin B lyase
VGFLDLSRAIFSSFRGTIHVNLKTSAPKFSKLRFFVFGMLFLILPGLLVQGYYLSGNQTKIKILSSQAAGVSDAIKQFLIPTSNSGPNAIIAAPNNTFWFVEFTGGKLGEFFAESASFKEFPIPENHSIPASLAIDNLGKIWFSDQSGPGSVWSFDPKSMHFTQYKTLTANSTPLFLLVDSQNNVWFTETTQNRIGELLYPSYAMTEYSLPSANSGPVELAFGQNQSTIWITETLTGKIANFNSFSHTFLEFTPPTSDYLKFPVGIVSDREGNLFISEHGGSAVVELVPGNDTFRKFPTSIPPPSVYPVSAVATVAIDQQGRLWFVEHFSNKVGRLDPVRNLMQEFQIPSSEPAYSVLNAIDSEGNFWFTEFSSNQIAEIPGNVSSPLGVSFSSTQLTVQAGATIHYVVQVNNNLSVPSTVQLNVTSSFTATGQTSATEVALNATLLTIPADGTGALNASITPDSSLPSGTYSVGIIASAGNVSTIGIAFLAVQGQFSLGNLLASSYQILLIVIVVVLAAVYFAFSRKTVKQRRKK